MKIICTRTHLTKFACTHENKLGIMLYVFLVTVQTNRETQSYQEKILNKKTFLQCSNLFKKIVVAQKLLT